MPLLLLLLLLLLGQLPLRLLRLHQGKRRCLLQLHVTHLAHELHTHRCWVLLPLLRSSVGLISCPVAYEPWALAGAPLFKSIQQECKEAGLGSIAALLCLLCSLLAPCSSLAVCDLELVFHITKIKELALLRFVARVFSP
ncbi:hypothetical protein DUNSADRAFT_13623 [Dunaliella salina]|uniref:Secreted protein n=1 Tax=Dunaliella salina TaxID=3046 RepID=A0ABQ7G900_DUNSA|nr:hypothetical protein DUNSADRAFT_13623 [Dunaliella salina]|eukprot:KAF5831092.1 hypothetical protein DUNSADRAFT_13623 [Dunaliella salina]